jgi:hypothetical protein
MCGFDSHILRDATRFVAAASDQKMTERLMKVGVEIHDSSDFLFECLSAPKPGYTRNNETKQGKAADVDEKTLCL